MAKLVKFPLALADGTKARTLEELREHADIASIIQYFDDNRLQRWLLANYLDDEAHKIKSVQESIKDEHNKLVELKARKVYDALGIPCPDDAQLKAYAENSAQSLGEQKTRGFAFDAEDEPDLKAAVSKFVGSGVNLSEWNIAAEETEEDDVFQVLLENKNEGIFAEHTVKKDDKFYEVIAEIIKKTEKLAPKTLHNAIALRKLIEATPESINGDSIQFGKYKWNVVKKGKTTALLVCECAVAKRRWDKVHVTSGTLALVLAGSFAGEGVNSRLVSEASDSKNSSIWEWLNEDFLKEAFSPEEIALLHENMDGDKITLLSEKDCDSFVPNQRTKKLKDTGKFVHWWTGDGKIIDDRGYFNAYINKNFQHEEHGVVPAIIVSF